MFTLKLRYPPLLKKNVIGRVRALPLYTINLPVPVQVNEHVMLTRQKDTSEKNLSFSVEKAPSIYDAMEKSEAEFENQMKIRFYAEVASLILQIGLGGLMTFVLLSTLLNSRGRGSGPPGFDQFISKKNYETDFESVNVKFSDVAGLDTAKMELAEIVDFLKSPEKYAKMGAKIPKGCILTGKPGLGKTLLAKAVAGEAQVPFLNASGSEFIELFVGVGASRVRELFKKARGKAPCIIFIDEIDAIGKSRSSGNMPGNDEREQTINQLLTEMDGFENSCGIVVLAATNRSDILDPALIRPGRFDRRIALELPGLVAREAILKVHATNKPLAGEVCLHTLAKNTVGFSGAELANLLNESAIVSARKGLSVIGLAEIEQALDRVIIGIEKTDKLLSDEKRMIVAYHEAGHALVALKIGDFDQIKKVSIIPRGSTGGVTIFEPNPDIVESGLYTRAYLENQLAVALGGRVAEELIGGTSSVTTGASSDLQRVQQIANSMVTIYGFSSNPKLANAAWNNETSQATQYSIDKEIAALTNAAYTRAKNIIGNHPRLLTQIAQALMEKETIDIHDIIQISK